MSEAEPSIEKLIQSYGRDRPGEVATLNTILKNIVLPGLGKRDVTHSKARELARTIPAHALYGLMEADGSAWRAGLRRKLPQTTTHQKAYLRALKRLIAHGEAKELLHPDLHFISPEWRHLIDRLAVLTESLSSHKRSAIRSGFKRLARWATAEGLTPTGGPGDRDGGRHLSGFHSTFRPEYDGGYYKARQAWNLLVEAHPDLGLAHWPGDQTFRCKGIPPRDWPPAVRSGVEAVFARGRMEAWRKATMDGYISQVSVYLGVLRERGIDCTEVFAEISDGEDALRLLFQGMPPGVSCLSATDLGDQLRVDPGMREDILISMRSLKGTYEGQASEANPFLSAAVAVLAESGRITSAANLVSKALALNRGLLGMTERHTGWLLNLRAQLRHLAKRAPAAYTQKKRQYFKTPDLWARLVRARGRLRAETERLLLESKAALGSRAAMLKDRWAVALRNEVYFGMMLSYPLRAANFSAMEIGRHFDPATFRITFAPEEVKNCREVDYELPDGGSLGDLRQLVTQYLEEARPILLKERSSPYFFVPNSKGGTRIPARGFNLILAQVGRRFLEDILPPGVRGLNPHMARHVCASFQLVVRDDLHLASQLLNDSPSTILRSYADVLASKKEATKQFLSTFSA